MINKIVWLGFSLFAVLGLVLAGWWIVRGGVMADGRVTTSANPETEIETKFPRKTNSWFSSLYNFPSQNVFALPGSFRITPSGIEIGAPELSVSENSVFGSHTAICLLGGGKAFSGAKVAGYGDWDVRVEIQGSGITKLQLIEGSVAQYVQSEEDLVLSCNGKNVEILNNRAVITSGKRILVVDTQAGQVVRDGEKVTLAKNAKYRLLVLPGNSSQELVNYGWYEIASTKVSYTQVKGEIETKLSWGHSGEVPLVTVWPHQWGVLANKYAQVLGKYDSVRGDLQLVKSDSVVTRMAIPELAESFVKVDSKVKGFARLQEKLTEDNLKYLTDTVPAGVYFKGTWLGAVTSLAQLNQLYERKEDLAKVLVVLKKELEAGLATLNYDEDLQMVVASNDEFGNKEGNDHHFHYGYYVRAAAVLEQLGVKLSNETKAKVELLIADFAAIKGDKTPRLRVFNAYHGHSYASGTAPFADGNNQESTSEALNAWYAIYLWGKVNGNKEQMELGQWLFGQDLQATKSYWFFPAEAKPEGFGHEMFSMVWDGKRDFATWFSANPMHIYGIQWLPLTPASTYLDNMPNQLAHLSELEQRLGENELIKHEWADLYVVYLSKVDKEKAVRLLPSIKSAAGAKLASLSWQIVLSE